MGAHRAPSIDARLDEDREPRGAESSDRSRCRQRTIPRRLRQLPMVTQSSAAALAPHYRPTPAWARVTRFFRVLAHLAGGVAATVFVLPWVGPSRKRALIRGWSRKLLQMLNVRRRIRRRRGGAKH